MLFTYDHATGSADRVEMLRDWPPGFFTLGRPASPEREFGSIEELPTPAGVRVRIVARRGPMLLLVALIGTALAMVTVRRSLQPITRLSAEAAKIAPGHHMRLDSTGVPEELLPLVTAVNRLLDRLQEAFAQQRRFNAVAAHELRTPLAALRARMDALPGDW